MCAQWGVNSPRQRMVARRIGPGQPRRARSPHPSFIAASSGQKGTQGLAEVRGGLDGQLAG